MFRFSSWFILFLSICYSGFVAAGTDSGFYLGGAIGDAELDISEDGIDFNDSDTGYKAFAGYNLGIIPFLDLAIELSYVDFGTTEDLGIDVDADTVALAALVGFDVGPLGLFAKAGMNSWDGEVSGFGVSVSDDGTDPMYGIGAKIQIGSFAVRGEFERFELDDIDIDFLSVGAAYTF